MECCSKKCINNQTNTNIYTLVLKYMIWVSIDRVDEFDLILSLHLLTQILIYLTCVVDKKIHINVSAIGQCIRAYIKKNLDEKASSSRSRPSDMIILRQDGTSYYFQLCECIIKYWLFYRWHPTVLINEMR